MATKARAQSQDEDVLHTKSASYRALNRSLKEGKLPTEEQINRYLVENALVEMPAKVEAQIDHLMRQLERQAKVAEKDRKRKARMTELKELGHTSLTRPDAMKGIFEEGAYACGIANMMLNDMASVDELLEMIPAQHSSEPWALKLRLWKTQFETRRFGEKMERPREFFLGDVKDDRPYQPGEKQAITETAALRHEFKKDNAPWEYGDNLMDWSMKNMSRLKVIAVDEKVLREKGLTTAPLQVGISETGRTKSPIEIGDPAKSPTESGDPAKSPTESGDLATENNAVVKAVQEEERKKAIEDLEEFVTYNAFYYGPYDEGTFAGHGAELEKKKQSLQSKPREFSSFKFRMPEFGEQQPKEECTPAFTPTPATSSQPFPMYAQPAQMTAQYPIAMPSQQPPMSWWNQNQWNMNPQHAAEFEAHTTRQRQMMQAQPSPQVQNPQQPMGMYYYPVQHPIYQAPSSSPQMQGDQRYPFFGMNPPWSFNFDPSNQRQG